MPIQITLNLAHSSKQNFIASEPNDQAYRNEYKKEDVYLCKAEEDCKSEASFSLWVRDLP